MAEKCDEDLRSEIGRKVCLVKGNDGEYRGYRKEILIENLSERENMTFVCIRCEGIMREVCTSSVGEQFCSCCKKEGEQTYPNLRMDNMVLSFKCSCPLMGRGCGWLGTIRDCEDHLDTCGYVYEACNLSCGEVLQREKLRIHEKENCPQRIVKCKDCHKEFKSCELPTHLEECPKMEVSCELCDKILCREDMTQHLEQYCVENEIECPFVKYKCDVTSIQRKYLNQHLEEKTTKHLELKLTAMEELILKQSETIEKQTGIISEQSREMEQSSRRIATLEKESKQSSLVVPKVGVIKESFMDVYKYKTGNILQYNCEMGTDVASSSKSDGDFPKSDPIISAAQPSTSQNKSRFRKRRS